MLIRLPSMSAPLAGVQDDASCQLTQQEPDPQVHEGYEWRYVLGGKLRLVLGEHDLVLQAGEAAEFDTHVRDP
jgi:Cupin domain